MRLEIRSEGPHHGQPVVVAGAPIASARAVGVLLHGRGATALSILDLGDAINRPDVAWLAPQARGNTWYPNRFLAPLESNEPWLSSALAAVDDVVAQVEEAGAPRSRIVLIGFSQGACLALETLIRTPGIAGGVAGSAAGSSGPRARCGRMRAGSTAFRSSSGAATSTSTFRRSGCSNRQTSCARAAPRSPRSSIRAWTTPSTTTRSRTCERWLIDL